MSPHLADYLLLIHLRHFSTPAAVTVSVMLPNLIAGSSHLLVNKISVRVVPGHPVLIALGLRSEYVSLIFLRFIIIHHADVSKRM